MKKKPEVGLKCWIITDIWETICAVPVMVIAEDKEGGVFTCRWQITEDYFEDYEGREPEELYETEEAARTAINEQRRIEEGK